MKWLLSKKMKFSKNQKGLTLVELLAVIVILGVIAAIAVPSIGGIIANSKANSDVQTETLLKDTAERYLTDTLPNGPTQASVTVAVLAGASYLKSATVVKQSATVATNYTGVSVGWTAAAGWVATAVTTTP